MEIDLSKFYDENDPRKVIRGPWTVGDLTFATTGRVAIEVPRVDGVHTADEIRAREGIGPPDMSIFFGDTFPSVDDPSLWRAASSATIKQFADRACGCNEGKTYEYEDCECCDGDGFVECETCGVEYTCHRCNGDGQRRVSTGKTCQTCGGTGKAYFARLYTDVKVDKQYWDIVADLPGAKYRTALGYWDIAPVCVVCNGGRAVVMPLDLSKIEYEE